MAEVIHHDIDHVQSNTGNGTGFLVGVILLVIVLFLLFYYGLPALRNASQSAAPQVNVPGKIDVNVHNSGK